MALPVALQVYTVRDYAERDFAEAMKKVKEIGYDYVELAGLYGHSVKEIRAALRAAGVKAISAHVPVAELLADTGATVATYKAVGVKYIVIPYAPEDMRPGVADDYDEVIKKIAYIGRICGEQGIQLLYHNHDFEFVKMPDGSYGLDYLYSHLPAEYLQTELDLCWVKVSGLDPVEYLQKYYGRAPIVHYKDYVGKKTENMYELIGTDTAHAETSSEFAFRPLGQGVQDMRAILKKTMEVYSKYVVVEQDNCYDQDTMEAAKQSREYLKSLGW